MDDLLQEVKTLFEQKLNVESLLSLSKDLQVELKQHFISSPQSMLPSFNYTLPTGDEEGMYLGIEVGGSNLWMALAHLQGRSRGVEPLRVGKPMVFPIDNEVKKLKEYAFFDWMVENIKEMLTEAGMDPERINGPLRMGNLNVRLDAIVNDSSATLLCRAYMDPATRLAVILGTGMNAAIHLPTVSLGQSKLAGRPKMKRASHVLTNTEFSMYGKNIFPTTRWDDHLNKHHTLPDYQPFEYLIAGGYMGEIVRLIILEAIRTAGLFDGNIPPSLAIPHAAELNTKILAEIETETLHKVRARLGSLWGPNPPSPYKLTHADAYFVQQTIRFVSSRSIAYFSTGVHALASLLQELETNAGFPIDLDHITIGCDGSVINRYPEYMEKAQKTIDQMIGMQDGEGKRVILEKTQASAVMGAGIAAALAARPEDEDEDADS
ncbi:hypothetical protein OEA41_004131 [Lepraria neglecta]|uniref:Phosphotransferase n=1 Tax=Lepraria neglecta TaxID=209136 RepID=A0AAE0DJ25_9LECA|nr:hypothetical protein OEA41_004131 [Lepraria neglecta]